MNKQFLWKSLNDIDAAWQDHESSTVCL